MDKFCVITNEEKDKNFEITRIIQNYIQSHYRICIIASYMDKEKQKLFGYTNVDIIPEDTECAIVLGGDGTIIRAANDLVHKNIPILGINFGTLGFLAEIEKQNIYTTLDQLFLDQCQIESRMMLCGTVWKGETTSSVLFSQGYVLNDIVITRSGYSRLISIKIYVNEQFVDTYWGDGVLISTPTGSTGYNLSAGGPVVQPTSDIMIITPICSHSLNTRSIIVSQNDKISAEIGHSKKTQKEEAIVTFDGREGIQLEYGNRIEIVKATVTTKLVKVYGSSFFEILRTKLGQSSNRE